MATADNPPNCGHGVMIELNFRRSRSEELVGPLLPHSRAVLVQCRVPRKTLAQRWLARIEGRAERHTAHVGGWTRTEVNALLADLLRLTAKETDDMTAPRELAELLETVEARHELAVATARNLEEMEP